MKPRHNWAVVRKIPPFLESLPCKPTGSDVERFCLNIEFAELRDGEIVRNENSRLLLNSLAAMRGVSAAWLKASKPSRPRRATARRKPKLGRGQR